MLFGKGSGNGELYLYLYQNPELPIGQNEPSLGRCNYKSDLERRMETVIPQDLGQVHLPDTIQRRCDRRKGYQDRLLIARFATL